LKATEAAIRSQQQRLSLSESVFVNGIRAKARWAGLRASWEICNFIRLSKLAALCDPSRRIGGAESLQRNPSFDHQDCPDARGRPARDGRQRARFPVDWPNLYCSISLRPSGLGWSMWAAAIKVRLRRQSG
jgi:hypothetical protein